MLGDCSEELSADDTLAAQVEAMATQIVAAEGAASVADTVFVAEIRFEVRKLGFPHEAGTAVAANVAGVAARKCCDVRAAGEFTWELVSTVRSSGVSEYPITVAMQLVPQPICFSGYRDYDCVWSEWTADRAPADGLLPLPLEGPGGVADAGVAVSDD